ncbi:MAG: glycoside hydrolase family 38 C-terminal domain-containing protein [Ignisphaera sp.]|nr:glycosyl hydrolase-related protein [Ignisphaera sp.]MDW8084845.1 glycoside hydrolase family 38 C-terminal domain-containing protein [Ignisphaera sp.]
MDLKDVERRVFDIMASSIIRIAPVMKWLSADGRELTLPIAVETRPDSLYTFKTKVVVPSKSLYTSTWFLKVVLQGNALLRVDGASYSGVDEAHTYVPIEPGAHELELRVSPRTMFGFHRWYTSIESVYLVEVEWSIIRLGLRILALLSYVERLPRDDPLRRDLETLLYDIISGIRVAPAVWQITLLISLLYERPLAQYFNRADLRNPYGDYMYLSGVYGIGILKGYLEEPNANYTSIEEAIAISRRIEEKLSEGLRTLREKHGKNGHLLIAGHSHIDAAWLWPRSETIEKTLRTFSTIVRLAREYPGFTFVQSSAQYYDWIEKLDPRLFEEIKKLIAEGRWIVVGGMWVESDVQLVDGESLARQFLYGQRYFLSRFGRTCSIGWIPDSFGFAGSLPQIMRKSGIEVFVTHKVVWNDTNEFPLHSFIWRGVDGNEIPVQVLVTSYNESLTPLSVEKYWSVYKNRDVVPFLVYSYGYGDGGGGPTREMLEYVDLINSMPRVPKVEYFSDGRYIEALKKRLRELPLWDGELYVEIHRGTYTTNLPVKECMARAEIAVREYEAIASLAEILGTAQYEKNAIDELWKLILFNQFHDVIPGSSIKEVYDDTLNDLSKVIESSATAFGRYAKSIVGEQRSNAGIAVFNILPWKRRDIVKVGKGSLGVPEGVECQEDGDGYYVYVEAPPLGYKLYKYLQGVCRASDGVKVYEHGDGIVLENDHVSVKIDGNGNISSLKLKRENLEFLMAPSNRLVAHIDRPGKWDAWDVTDEFLSQGEELKTLEKPVVVARGPLVACVEVAKGIGASKVVQSICLYKDSPVVEVRNKIVWREKSLLVKVWFETTLNSRKALYDIPYGVIERSTLRETSWERARFEVPAVRWAEIYDERAGLAVIAPSRHGYTAVGNKLALSLIRSPVFPNPWSDLGEFETVYYIYPHTGDYDRADLARIVQEKLFRLKVVEGVGSAKQEVSLFSIEPKAIVLGAFKRAEDGEGYTVRLFNPYREAKQIALRFSVPLRRAIETNIIETEVYSELNIENSSTLRIDMKPLEVKTIKIYL